MFFRRVLHMQFIVGWFTRFDSGKMVYTEFTFPTNREFIEICYRFSDALRCSKSISLMHPTDCWLG